jgi:ATP-dependent RNA helicase DHX57
VVVCSCYAKLSNSGETGSGKSTQSVQFVLDDLIKRKLGAIANIVCTQPRRISAIGLADRVSDERCQEVGREIGYAIRGESKQTRGITKCTFMTTGVLLRRMQMGDTLDDVSHIVIDEVHERSLDTDMLLVLVKRIISKRKDLKIILMSATLDADVFSEYFGGDGQVAKVNIEGRTFPVTDYYLENIVHLTGFTGGGRIQQNHEMQENEDMDEMDPTTRSIVRGLGDRLNYNLIATTVKFIHDRMAGKPGSILIFLPGKQARFMQTPDFLTITRYNGNLPLHRRHPKPSRWRQHIPRSPFTRLASSYRSA